MKHVIYYLLQWKIWHVVLTDKFSKWNEECHCPLQLKMWHVSGQWPVRSRTSLPFSPSAGVKLLRMLDTLTRRLYLSLYSQGQVRNYICFHAVQERWETEPVFVQYRDGKNVLVSKILSRAGEKLPVYKQIRAGNELCLCPFSPDHVKKCTCRHISRAGKRLLVSIQSSWRKDYSLGSLISSSSNFTCLQDTIHGR